MNEPAATLPDAVTRVTVTVVPTVPVGAFAVMDVTPTVGELADTVPKSTRVTDVRFVPSMVTGVPTGPV